MDNILSMDKIFYLCINLLLKIEFYVYLSALGYIGIIL